MQPSMTPPDPQVTSFTEGFLEYTSLDGELWRVEDGGGLRTRFGIHGTDTEIGKRLAAWQEFMALNQTWEVVRRRYGVHLLLGVMEADELRAWPAAELAAKLKLPVVEIEAQEEAAAKAWRMHGVAVARRPEVPAAVEPEALTGEAASALLRKHGFAPVADAEERDYMALRCVELSEVLENDGQRALCRGMIVQEVFLTFVIDPAIRALRDAIREKNSREVKVDCTKENKQLMELMNDRGKAVERMEGTLAAMGISEKQTNQMKRKGAFQDSVSFLIKGVRAYHAHEDNALIDGVHRAAEVAVLTRPFTQRAAQFRPDLSLFVVPAALVGMFDPDFVLPKVGRNAHRALMYGFREGLRQARGDAGETVADLEEEKTEVLLEEAERQDTAALPAGMRAAATQAFQPNDTAE